MKSSDFERLGDWQRKQQWGFEDALNDKISRNNRMQQRSSVISTDTTNMDKKKNFKIDCEKSNEFIIKCFQDVRGYSEEIDSDNKNFVYYSNGKSTLRINTNFDCICMGYRFDEYFENTDVISKGSFPSKSSGISYFYIDREYYKRDDYKGSEYFRQAFLFNDKLATISLKLKKVDEIQGWGCYHPKFSIYIEVSYFDVNNNESLKGLNTEAKLDIISITNSFISRDAIPDYTEIIPVVDKVIGSSIDSDGPFFRDRAHLYQDEIQKSLSHGFKKIEHYLGTNLEKKEKLDFIKKLIPQKNR